LSPPPPGLFVRHLPGHGPLVVLVHGSMDRSSSFARLRSPLRDLSLVVYDRRGYGRSRDLGGAGLGVHVDDLLAVVDGRPCVALGHSFGGDVALAAALARPDLVRAVVAYEAPLPWMPWWPRRSAGGQAASAATPAEAAEAFVRRLVGAARWEGLPEATKQARRAEGPALVAEMASIRSSRPPFDPGDLRVPLVVGTGSRSADHHRRGARALAEAVEGAELVEVPGAGHDAHLTHPDQVAAMVRRALGRALGGPAGGEAG
jgi:pimeloyl-ACP methyl ester carboxylesterase